MSGLFAQLGTAEEVRAAVPSPSAGTWVAPNAGTITFGSAHGLSAGDVLTLVGVTPAGWNGSWTVLTVPTSTTLTVAINAASLGAMTVFGTATATAWGVQTVVNRFHEFVSEGLKLEADRIDSKAIRAGNMVERVDDFIPWRKGVSGPLEFEVLTRGFGRWFKHALGAIATTGPTDTAAFTHTATIAKPVGLGLTVQVGRPTLDDTPMPFTFSGCKIATWELSCDAGGFLMLKVELVGKDESLVTVLATASYPAQYDILSFVGGAVTIGGVAQGTVKKLSIKGNNSLDTSRFALKGAGSRNEPLTTDLRTIDVTVDMEFESLAHYNRFSATTAAGTLAAVTAVFTGPVLIPGAASTFPSLTITLPNVRNDGESPTVTGTGIVPYALKGVALNSSSGNDAVTLTYVTADSAP